MLLKKINTVGIAGMIALSACTKNDKDGGTKGSASELINTTSVAASGKSNSESAEKLALTGEKMALNPGGFIYADEIMDKALSLDPQNQRALFYKSILKPFMAQRGIWARITPWMNKQKTETQADFARQVATMPPSAVKTFLLDGQPDIATVSDWQKHLTETRASILSARQILQDLKHSELAANFTIYNGGSNGDDNDVIARCSPKKVEEGLYEIPQCPYEYKVSLKLARPDFETLSLGLSMLATGYTSILTAYSFEGLENIQAKLEVQKRRDGYTDINKTLAILRSEPEFLKIRDAQALKDILSLGNEGLEAINYVLKHQPTLCKTGQQSANNRPGYLFAEGMCQNAESSHMVMVMNAYLRGPVEIIKTVTSSQPSKTDSSYITEINVGQILDNPIQDLKDILPTHVEPKKGLVFPDESMGGLFPHHDASAFFNFGMFSEQGQNLSNSVTIQPTQDLQ